LEANVKRLLTSTELAEVFGLTHQTLRTWRLNGTGPPYFKVGDKAVRYDQEKVREWLEDREKEGR
jgi:predicted DNA-binding transcriptional regulator AlpA